MKTTLTISGRLAALAAGAGLLCAVASASAQTAFPSPVGTWDVQVSGAQGYGLAYITFNEDFTFTGYELLTVKKFSADSNDRGELGDSRNLDVVVTTNGVFIPTNRASAKQLMGFGYINGPWNYDADGKVVGYYTQEVEESGDGTNATVYINPVSFRAKVVPGSRITMLATTPDGKMNYRGLPATMEIPDFTGQWFGEKKQNDQTDHEFFNLSPGYETWLFDLTGSGPGYTTDGICLVSQRKYVGVYLRETTGNNRSVYGTYNRNSLLLNTKGTDSTFNPLKFKGTKVPDSSMPF